MKYPNRWALTLGTGLALYGMHWVEQPFLDYVFLPQIGLIIIVFCVGFYFIQYPQKPDFGSKQVWIPMLVIVASIVAWVFIDFSMRTVASAFYGISLFAVYLVARQLGKNIFTIFIPFVIIIAISCIINGLINPGVKTGGINTNYCAISGFMIFGTVVNKFKWQWILAILVVVALFFTGSSEALFFISVFGIIMLVRRDWSKRLLVPIGTVIILIVTWGQLGNLAPLWYNNNNLKATYNLVSELLTDIERDLPAITSKDMDEITTNRWERNERAITDMQPLGHGFWVTMPEYTDYSLKTVHNVPLVIVDQIGPTAGLAWLVITMFCLVKTRWKYAWATVLILSVFDHYIWTQFAPYWWVLVGVSTTSSLKTDLIFRRKE